MAGHRATRDAVRLAIKDFLWSDETGLPVDNYDEADVQNRAEEIYRRVYRVYPTLPSPYYDNNGRPIARLRPFGEGDWVEVLWWSYRGKWGKSLVTWVQW